MKIYFYIFTLFLSIFYSLTYASFFEYKKNSQNKNPKFLECMTAINNGIIFDYPDMSTKIIVYENSVYYVGISNYSMLCEKWGELKDNE